MPIAGTFEAQVGTLANSHIEPPTSESGVAQVSGQIVADALGRFQARISNVNGNVPEIWIKPASGGDAPSAGWTFAVYEEDVSEVRGRVLVDVVDAVEGSILPHASPSAPLKAVRGTLVVEATGMGNGKKASISLWVTP